jgi:hypothetical protein
MVRCFVDDDGYQVVAYRYWRDGSLSVWHKIVRKRSGDKVALFLPKFVCDTRFFQ